MTDILLTAALLAALCVASMQGCGNSKEASADETPAYIVEAQKQFGDAFECEPNATGEFILCVHHPENKAPNPVPGIAFFVFDVAKSDIIVEQSEVLGRASWVTDYEIELRLVPGIVTDDGRGAPRYRIDARTGDRRRVDGVNETPK